MDKILWRLNELSQIWKIETDVLLEKSMGEEFELFYFVHGEAKFMSMKLGEIHRLNCCVDATIFLNDAYSRVIRTEGFAEVVGGKPLHDFNYILIKKDENNEKQLIEGIVHLNELQYAFIILEKALKISVDDLWVSKDEKERFEEENELFVSSNTKTNKPSTRKGLRSPLKKCIDSIDRRLWQEKNSKPSHREVWSAIKANEIIKHKGPWEIEYFSGDEGSVKVLPWKTFKKYVSELRKERAG